MARSKYINTFDTTADYNNYIESALPEFPNVGYDKQAGEVKIMRTSPNSHLIYGTVNDVNTQIDLWINNTSTFNNNGKVVTAHIDPLNNTFYVDQSDLDAQNITSITALVLAFASKSSITSISKFKLDVSNVTLIQRLFSNCTNLKTLNLYGCDFSNVTTNSGAFYNGTMTDVYINVEATLMKLTNNLTSHDNDYIPASATIHYDNGSEVIDYKWQNNAWTPQTN